MKWLPVPSVPRCAAWTPRPSLACLPTIAWKPGASVAHASAAAAGRSCHAPRSPGPPLLVRPCGTAASIAERSAARSSGRSFAVSDVCTAIMPQPMSTPTAAGMIAPLVAITEPIVAPLPWCTSGIAATHLWMNGSAASRASCALASASNGTPRVHDFTGTPPGTCMVS
jgi:hypothetical protein